MTHQPPIAVIGIGCRFPGGVHNTETFWKLLCDGVDAIEEVPPTRFDIDTFYDPRPGVAGKIASRWGGFISAISGFDRSFFGLSPREAAAMDPQQRLILEVAWEALEDGLTPPQQLWGRQVGVYLGMLANEYGDRQIKEVADPDVYTVAGGSRNAAAGRLSYLLGLEGPSLVVDSDRSSSLVAVHLACQSLCTGESEVALAGGTNLVLEPDLSIAFSRARMLAPDGRCKFADARANGFVRSDGVGVVVLKPLAKAQTDGDRVYAVIRGSAVTNAGGLSHDIMTPSERSQRGLLRQAFQRAGVDPAELDYIEAHGPGTPMGDPIEIKAIGAVVGEGRSTERPCLVGSVKTNIGHTEAAAGIAGLIKVVLSLKHREIPPSLHYERGNPAIPFESLKVKVVDQRQDWPGHGLAGVSSFGLTGTNAHVVIEAPPELTSPPGGGERTSVLPLSARSGPALDELARQYADHLQHHEVPLETICYSAAVGRDHHRERTTLVAHSRVQLVDQLLECARGDRPVLSHRARAREERKLAFVFSGQGSQWPRMGQQLREEPVFRDALQECEAHLTRHVDWSLMEELDRPPDQSRLDRNDVMQPAIFAIQVALARLFAQWGIKPTAVVGHSMGEVAAAHVAGVLTIEDATKLVCRRSALMARQAGRGRMAVVELPADELASRLRKDDAVAVAGLNGPTATVLSGDSDAVEAKVEELKAEGVRCAWVRTDVACHSRQMDSAQKELQKTLADLRPVAGQIAIYSTVEAQRVNGKTLGPRYWGRNLREAVRFAPTLQRLLENNYTTFVEVSPHPVLTAPLLDVIDASPYQAEVYGALQRQRPDRAAMMATLGSLYCNGYTVSWDQVYPGVKRRMSLPLYPWQRQRCWYQADRDASSHATLRAAEPDTEQEHGDQTQNTRLSHRLENLSPSERRVAMVDHIRRETAKVLGFDPSLPLDPQTPFRDLGLKSIMAVELRTRLSQDLDRPLPATLLFNYPTIEALVEFLGEEQALAASTSSQDGSSASSMLGEILVDGGAVTPEQLQQALAEQAQSKQRLGEVLVRLGLVAPGQLNQALLSQQVEPIAVVGIGCRFPGDANDPTTFWRLLQDGRNAIREIPGDRWNVDAFYDPDPTVPGKMHARWGGFLSEVGTFDPTFFGITPREAEAMDPQQRLLLEVTWEAFENGGHAPRQLASSRTGVFVGMMNNNDYGSIQHLFGAGLAGIDGHYSSGNAMSIAAGRVSYLLGLHGPCMAVDTACSSTLVAVHLACQSLRAGECQMAVAGGVNLMLSPEIMIAFSKTRMLSPDGQCRTFDASANGYVRGEGCGVVVLKRLTQAIQDNDNIMALLRGTAVNQDGRSSGITAPSGKAQEAVIREALANGGIRAAQVSYVEAHGTGTSLGDPIEFQALESVLGGNRPREQRFAVGSVKTNIGHLEAAAGAAGLIKTILALQHEEIPPHLNLRDVNPHITLDQNAAVVPTHTMPWQVDEGPRVAGISSFGFSGTNAHVVVEQAPSDRVPEETRQTLHILPLSARNEGALKQLVERYLSHLTITDQTAADICYTAGAGRSHFELRLAVIGKDKAGLHRQLDAVASNRSTPSTRRGEAGRTPRVAFLYTGQGAQYVGMGRQLYETQPVFRKALDDCAEILDNYLEQPLLSVVFGKGHASQLINQTGFTQPALFALEVALTKLWRSWGVEPSAVLGHSVGELVAAWTAGVYSLEDGLKLIAERGRLMQALPSGGAMAAVFADEQRVIEALEGSHDDVSLAAINGTNQVVISGVSETVDRIMGQLSRAGVRTRRLPVSHAFHSPLMNPMLEAFNAVADEVGYSPPQLPIISNVSGTLAERRHQRDRRRSAQPPGTEKRQRGEDRRRRRVQLPNVCDAKYWTQHVRAPVRFSDGLKALADTDIDVFLELGPNPTLVRLGQRMFPKHGGTWGTSLASGRDDWEQILGAAADLYVRGANIDWEGLHHPHKRRKVSLPTYAFQRKRYWKEGVDTTAQPVDRPAMSSLAHTELSERILGQRLRSPSIKERIFEAVYSADDALLSDHRLYGPTIVAGAVHLSRVLEAAGRTWDLPCRLENVRIPEPLLLGEDESKTVQLIATARDDYHHELRIYSHRIAEGETELPWTLHLTGDIEVDARPDNVLPELDVEEVKRHCPDEMPVDEFYRQRSEHGLELGPGFLWLTRLHLGKGEALGEIRPPEDSGPLVHPGIFDTLFQTVTAAGIALAGGKQLPRSIHVPVEIDSVRVLARPFGKTWCHATTQDSAEADTIVGNVQLFDEFGQLVLDAAGVVLKRAPRQLMLRRFDEDVDQWLFEVEWRPESLPPRALDRDDGRWLVFSDQVVGPQIAEQLPGPVVLVERGERYAALAPDRYMVDSTSASDFKRLIDELPPLRGVVHLWSLDARAEGIDAIDAFQKHTTASILYLTQALLGDPELTPRLWLVTRGAQRVADERPAMTGLMQAPVWGLGRVIDSEVPGLLGGTLDLDAASENVPVSALVDEICSTGDEVAFRGGRRYVARLQRYQRPDHQKLEIDPEGAYVVTGGLGGLGLQVAEWLAEIGARSIVLVSRGRPSESVTRAVAEIERAGADVQIVQADITDRDQVDLLFARVESGGRAVKGIVHAAGLLHDATLMQQDWDKLEAVMGPKIRGTAILLEAAAERTIDFMVLFSSFASLLGNPAQANYAAANAFLDAAASFGRACKIPVVTINWGPWKGQGMAADLEEHFLERWAIGSIPGVLGIRALEQVVACDAAQVCVMQVSLPALAERLRGRGVPALLSDILQEFGELPQRPEAGETDEGGLPALKRLPEEERVGKLTEHVREVVMRILKLDESQQISETERLDALGLDSLLALDLVKELGNTLGQQLAPTLVFEYGTIREIAGFLCQQIDS